MKLGTATRQDIKKLELLPLDEVIKNVSIRTEYQPIVDLGSSILIGNEALARFEYEGKLFSPEFFFSLFEKDSDEYHRLEMLTKSHQVKHRPHNTPLFLNLNPCHITKDEHIAHWESFIGKHDNIVLEIKESKSHKEIERSKVFIDKLKENPSLSGRFRIALDDIFSIDSLFSSVLFMRSDIIKIDVSLTHRASEDDEQLEFLKGFTEMCKRYGKEIILEGVETLIHKQCANFAGINFIQGYLLKDLALWNEERSLSPIGQAI
ncbi:MAG: EAL domain-containing protein [Epsilonproteobacteria bacterium]|nr:EAL domain-containing protein [Campylobacterota bacterium]